MKQILRTATNDELDELSREEGAVVAGGMIDDGHTPAQTYTPGRLSPEGDEVGTMAGFGFGSIGGMD